MHCKVLRKSFPLRTLRIFACVDDNFKNFLVLVRVQFFLRQAAKEGALIQGIDHPRLKLLHVGDSVKKATRSEPKRVLMAQGRRNDAPPDVLPLPMRVWVAEEELGKLALFKAVGAELHHVELLKPHIVVVMCFFAALPVVLCPLLGELHHP